MTPYFSQIIGFDISLEMICMKCQNLFSRKNKKNISKQNVLCWNFYLECQALRLLKQSLGQSILIFWYIYMLILGPNDLILEVEKHSLKVPATREIANILKYFTLK